MLLSWWCSLQGRRPVGSVREGREGGGGGRGGGGERERVGERKGEEGEREREKYSLGWFLHRRRCEWHYPFVK